MLLMSTFSAILVLGGWLLLLDNFLFNLISGTVWLSLKTLIGVTFFVCKIYSFFKSLFYFTCIRFFIN